MNNDNKQYKTLQELQPALQEDGYLILGHGTGRSGSSHEIVESIFNEGLRTKENSLYYTTVGLETSNMDKFQNQLTNWPHLASEKIILAKVPIEYINMYGNASDLDNEKYGAFTIDKKDDMGKVTKYLNPSFIIGCYDTTTNQVEMNNKYEQQLSNETLSTVKLKYKEAMEKTKSRIERQSISYLDNNKEELKEMFNESEASKENQKDLDATNWDSFDDDVEWTTEEQKNK